MWIGPYFDSKFLSKRSDFLWQYIKQVQWPCWQGCSSHLLFPCFIIGVHYDSTLCPRKGSYTQDIFTHNIAIKGHFDKKIFFSSKYCNDISKYLESSQKNIFNTHREKILDEKCLFIAISFYLSIAISRAKMSSV